MVFAGGRGTCPGHWTRGMALNGLFCVDVLRPLNLVPIADFTYKYHLGFRHSVAALWELLTYLLNYTNETSVKSADLSKFLQLPTSRWWKLLDPVCDPNRHQNQMFFFARATPHSSKNTKICPQLFELSMLTDKQTKAKTKPAWRI